jgi:predicted small lipoprotein YifL
MPALRPRRFALLLAAALALAAAAGCGQKGDLYLPDEAEEAEKKQGG